MSEEQKSRFVVWFWIIVIGSIILIWFAVAGICSLYPPPCLEYKQSPV